MALTQISTGGIKDDAVTDAKLPANSVGNSEMKDDAVGIAELSASGTAGNTTFLRGDNTWATPPDTDTNTQLSTEQVQDIVGAMFTGNTETNITATYEDSDGTIDLVANTGIGGATGVTFNDSVAANFGTDGDQAIWHTGTVGYIRNSTGGFCIRNDNFSVKDDGESEIMITAVKDGAVDLYYNNKQQFETTNAGITVINSNTDVTGAQVLLKNYNNTVGYLYGSGTSTPDFGLLDSQGHWGVKVIKDGAVELYHDNSKKFETTSGGIEVTGGINLSTNLSLVDSGEIKLGTGDDLKIYHDASGYNQIVAANDHPIQIKTATENMIKAIPNGAVEFYHDNTKKFETHADGLHIGDGGNLDMPHDSSKIVLGASDDLQIYHDGGNSYVHDNGTGSLILRSSRVSFNDTSNNEWARINSDGLHLGGTTSANAMDDYEEGIYTPTPTCGGGSVTFATNRNECAYTKVGRICNVTGRLDVSAISSPSGDIKISLPFTAANLADLSCSSATAIFTWNANGDGKPWVGWCDNGETVLYLREGHGDQPPNSADRVQVGTEFRINLTYVCA